MSKRLRFVRAHSEHVCNLRFCDGVSHQLGNISGRTVPLLRASQLYSLVLKTLATTSKTDSSEDDSRALLQCLVLNNLAQLQHDQCDYLRSQYYLERMRNLVATTVCLQDYLNDTEADEIMLNLMCVRPPSAAHAA